MRTIRLAIDTACNRRNRRSLGLALLAIATWGSVQHGFGLSGLEPRVADGSAAHAPAVAYFVGLYMGFSWLSYGSLLEARLHTSQILGWRACVLLLAVGGGAAIGRVSDALGSALTTPSLATWSEWAWSVALLTLVALASASWCEGAGRRFLVVVAFVWWIPSILPPSLLLAVPRALRNETVGVGGIALPSTASAWLADTALAAGLLLLAWAPRRATFRGHEVRHPG